jgi:fumarate hydratase class II
MPGKVNPVMAEALMMTAARVMGNHTTITVAGSRGNLELNAMMPVLASSLLESISILAGACTAFTEKCVVGIDVNAKRCRDLLERNPSISTALNARLGYDQAAEVAKEAVRQGRSVREVVLELGLVPEEELDRILEVRSMTEGGGASS